MDCSVVRIDRAKSRETFLHYFDPKLRLAMSYGSSSSGADETFCRVMHRESAPSYVVSYLGRMKTHEMTEQTETLPCICDGIRHCSTQSLNSSRSSRYDGFVQNVLGRSSESVPWELEGERRGEEPQGAQSPAWADVTTRFSVVEVEAAALSLRCWRPIAPCKRAGDPLSCSMDRE